MKNYKKLFLSFALILGIIFTGTNMASAFTAQEVELLITLLNLNSNQATLLRTMVSGNGSSDGNSGGGGSIRSCFVFERNLGLGSTGDNVVALQTWLINQGYDIPAISSGRTPKGYYGVTTMSAVTRFQTGSGLAPANGYFGPASRAYANAHCGVINPNNQIRITSPQVGATLVVGQPVNIIWSTSVTGSEIFDITEHTDEGKDLIAGGLTVKDVACNYIMSANQNATCSYTWIPVSTSSKFEISINKRGTSESGSSGSMTIISVNHPYVRVTYPNGGEILGNNSGKDNIAQIRWNSTNLPSSATIDIGLTDQNGEKGSSYDIASNIPNTGSYMWPYNPSILNGKYRIIVSVHTPNTTVPSTRSSDLSDSYFTITTNTRIEIGLPVDLNISGSVVLVSANEDKAFKWDTNGRIHAPDWKWDASMINDGSVDKYIKRMILVHNTGGEGWATDSSANNPVGKSLYILASTLSRCDSCDVYNIQTDNLYRRVPSGQKTSFYLYGYPSSHRFTGGTLVVEFTDGTKANINIESSSITPGSIIVNNESSISVTSPNGGTYERENQLNVRWTSYSGDFDYYRIMLGNTTANTETQIDDGYQISKNQNSYSTFAVWTFVDRITSASGMSSEAIKNAYYVRVEAIKNDRVSGGVMNTGKSSTFSIRANTVTTQPSITVLSPNGGETWQAGADVVVTFNPSGAYGRTLTVVLVNADTTHEYQMGQAFSAQATDRQVYSFTLPASIPTGSHYRVRVSNCEGNGDCSIQDVSDSYFTITSSQTIGSCTDSDGGKNPDVAGLTDGRVNGLGSSFNDKSVASNGGQCSGDSCTSVAEGYCTPDGKVSNILMSCASGYSINGVCAVRATSQTRFTVTLIDANTDVVSGNFNPGYGVRLQDPNANDWHWRAVTNPFSPAKTISSIDIINEDNGQAWSTGDNQYYPLVVLKNGVKLNSQYGQTIDIPAGSTTLDLYGQPELKTFPGAVATIRFTDGTSMSVNIPSSSVIQASPTSANNISASAFDSLVDFLKGSNR
ncbi:MAG: peptidoglycan-binding domain-containing protein [bacterium]|nr:peptidoglycan-binding domain-containing protein [bacterium]